LGRLYPLSWQLGSKVVKKVVPILLLSSNLYGVKPFFIFFFQIVGNLGLFFLTGVEK